jgi:hypothetical protein
VKVLRDFVEAVEQSLADGFEVRGFGACGISGEMLRLGHGAAPKVRKILVEARDFALRGRRRPADRAENHAHAHASDGDGRGGMRVRFDWIFDGADEDRALHDGYHDSAGGQARDGFLVWRLGLLLRCRSRGGKQEGDCQRRAERSGDFREFREAIHLA